MACSNYILTNTGTTVVTFNYRRCSDSMWQYQVPLTPNQTKTIWLINGTYNASPIYNQQIVLTNLGSFPIVYPTPTPTPTVTTTATNTPTPSVTVGLTPTVTPSVTASPTLTHTPTPTKTSTSTPTPSITTSLTPSLTPSNTPTLTTTPTVTPTNTPTSTTVITTPTVTTTSTVTPSVTPTNTLTPSITPTNTETPTNTPTNTLTPSITPSNTPTPSHTPTVETIQIASSAWTTFTQQQFQDWLISGSTGNNNPNAVVTSFSNVSGNITAGVYNVTWINIGSDGTITSISQLPASLQVFFASNVALSSLPPLTGTSLSNLTIGSTSISTIPNLPTTLQYLNTSGCSSLLSLPALSGLTSLLQISSLNSGLQSLPVLPASVVSIDIRNCNFSTSSLNNAVDFFLNVGTLPKYTWQSQNQNTFAQPDPPFRARLSNPANVDYAVY